MCLQVCCVERGDRQGEGHERGVGLIGSKMRQADLTFPSGTTLHDHTHMRDCVLAMIVLLYDRVASPSHIFTQICLRTLDLGSINQVYENTENVPTLSRSGLKDLKAI